MPEQKQSYYNFSSNMLQNQSILDIFVLQDIIDPSDVSKLQSRFKTNREIENFLVSNRIVSRDTVNKAYSILLKLPYVEIKNLEIPDELLKMIPEKTVKKYGFIPFHQEDGIVRIAVSRPADLLVSYEQGITKVFANKNLEVEIFITGESDLADALKQYNKNYDKSLLLKKASFPVVFLRNQSIPAEYLKKIPMDFIEKYRLVVFGKNMQGHYQFACEEPDSIITQRIIDFIKRENSIKAEVYATSREDIDFVLSSLKKDMAVEEKKKDENAEQNPVGEKSPVNFEQTKPEAKKNASSEDAAPFKSSGIKSILSSIVESKEPEVVVDTVSDDIDEDESKTQVQEHNELQNKSNENVIKNSAPVVEGTNSSNNANSSKDLGAIKKESEPVERISMQQALENNNLGALLDSDVKTDADLNKVVKSGNIPKIVAGIIDYALNNRSSDIHIEPGDKVLRVRCRIDGILKDVAKVEIADHPALISRIKIMSHLKIDESRIPQDGRFNVVFKRGEVDVRVSTLPTVHGEKVVMRVLDKSQGILSLEDLGMVGSAFNKTSEAIKNPYGIILSTGPTGSGKSTTLYAVLNRISIPGVNIVTLEDPVEYEIPGINQCQIKPEIGFTFATGLRSILRQDPNVIMVGEIRDAETAGMATHAALTGHLVLSTLHTNDTAGALPRLINMGVEPFLITSSINLVIAQRLVRRICPKCKEEMKVPQKLMDQLKVEIDRIPPQNQADRARIPQDLKLYYGRGCPECNHGFKGRIGIYEAMSITEAIEDLAVAKSPANVIKDQALREGMITMKQDGILKAFAGLTTVDEVFQAVINN